MKKIHLILFFILFSTFFISLNADAAFFDPKNKWQTITTEHFRIHYPKRIEKTAIKSAEISEEVYPGLIKRWDWKPWGKIQMILSDDKDDANGWASFLPYNWIALWIAPPEPDSAIANYDDWLRMLISHELTHIVQLDGAEENR
ncbi:MAG: hypothetical protein ABIE74_03675 [Pseudomonadota bacterium]